MSSRKPVVIVTGASRGIGLAVVKDLLSVFNANVIAISRTRTPELAKLSSDSLLIVECDITDEAALIEAIALGEKTYHHIDGLILNAGTTEPGCRIGDDTPLSAWKTHYDVNFFSLVTALHAALPALCRSELVGKVVFVSSGSAMLGTPGFGPYNSSKAAMNGLNRTLAEEQPSIVSVALRPGMVDTDMQTNTRANGAAYLLPETHKMFIAVHEGGKLLKPEDPSHVIAALAIKATKELSGKFVTWNDEECKDYRRA